MKTWLFSAAAIVAATLSVRPVLAEPVIWGLQAEQFEYRVGEGENLLAWDFDAMIGKDELKFVWRSEAEFLTSSDRFETLENQFRLQTPISPFFDAVAGVRFDNPDGPNRTHGVLGIHGLAQQWFEVDADLFLSEYPSARFEVEYEGLITNQITFTPSIELDIPLADDEATGRGGFAPTLELGARLSYDLIDRSVSPYLGVHWERTFGESANRLRAEDEDVSSVFLVAGVRLLF